MTISFYYLLFLLIIDCYYSFNKHNSWIRFSTMQLSCTKVNLENDIPSNIKHNLVFTKTIILWFRNNLRINDNNMIYEALLRNPEDDIKVICFYCFDDRLLFQHESFSNIQSSDYQSILKLGSEDKIECYHRIQFLIESIKDLRENLKTIGLDLFVFHEPPEHIIPLFLHDNQEIQVYVDENHLSYENYIINNVIAALNSPKHILLKARGNYPLIHPDDMPREFIKEFPNSFTRFRKYLEDGRMIIRDLHPINKSHVLKAKWRCCETTRLQFQDSLCYLPSVYDLISIPTEDTSRVIISHVNKKFLLGGESAAMNRIKQWIFQDRSIDEYMDTRNDLLHTSSTSKFSTWLSLGCLSPRIIYHSIKDYERLYNIQSQSTYWMLFELLVRDYFYYYCKTHKSRIFHLDGPKGYPNEIPWKINLSQFYDWKHGLTGYPLVDASMRELKQTGYLSNRGRQVVASFLIYNLNIDWRLGAQYFERVLIDSDVTSNYGNWNSIACIQPDKQRQNRFNILLQSIDYDSNGEYIKHWLSELKDVPIPLVFEPWKLSLEQQLEYHVHMGQQYPLPIVTSSDSIVLNKKMKQRNIGGKRNKE